MNRCHSLQGFLANLATLLNDADVLSKKNSGIAKSAITPPSLAKSEPTDRPSSKVTTENSIARSLTERHGADKNGPTPSAGSVENTLKTEGKDSAPIFALFHGKIVPLGKLPDSSFKKSHTETRYDESKSKEVSEKLENHKSDGMENGEAKSEVRVAERQQHTSNAGENEKKDKSKSLSPLQLSRLSTYFHNLDSKNKADTETRMVKSRIKDVTGTAKDEVPEIMPAIRNSEFLKHVKGIVLDDGKMVSFKGKQAEVENEQVTIKTHFLNSFRNRFQNHHRLINPDFLPPCFPALCGFLLLIVNSVDITKSFKASLPSFRSFFIHWFIPSNPITYYYIQCSKPSRYRF